VHFSRQIYVNNASHNTVLPRFHTMDNLASDARFAPFNIKDVAYKTVRDVPIQASILTPKTGLTGKRPLLIRWHGGFWMTGHRLFADWYPSFILDFAVKHGAVSVAPDYRLLPEASGTDILHDMQDFFAWVLQPGNLAAHLPEGVEVDFDRVIVTGESAGGWVAWQSAVHFSDVVKAAIIHYPVIDLRAPHYTQKYHKDLFTPPAPQFPEHVLNDYLAGLTGKEVVPCDASLARFPIAASVIQQGRLLDFFGQDRGLLPLEQFEDNAVPKNLPPIWVLHGRQDSAVPIEGTEKLVKALRAFGEDGERLHVSIEDGEHGFDNHAAGTGEAATLETPWVKQGIEFVEQYWPL
jgi:acetyl esterase/lipase